MVACRRYLRQASPLGNPTPGLVVHARLKGEIPVALPKPPGHLHSEAHDNPMLPASSYSNAARLLPVRSTHVVLPKCDALRETSLTQTVLSCYRTRCGGAGGPGFRPNQ